MKRINADIVRTIRAEFQRGGASQQAICRRYRITANTCKSIIKGMSHAHIPDDPVDIQDGLLDGKATASLLHQLEQATDFGGKVGFHLRTAEMFGIPSDWLADFRKAADLAAELESIFGTINGKFRKIIEEENKPKKKAKTKTAKREQNGK